MLAQDGRYLDIFHKKSLIFVRPNYGHIKYFLELNFMCSVIYILYMALSIHHERDFGWFIKEMDPII